MTSANGSLLRIRRQEKVRQRAGVISSVMEVMVTVVTLAMMTLTSFATVHVDTRSVESLATKFSDAASQPLHRGPWLVLKGDHVFMHRVSFLRTVAIA
jgi:hypothetical protein